MPPQETMDTENNAATLRRLYAGDETAVSDGLDILCRMGWQRDRIPAPLAAAELAGWINAELLRDEH